MLSYLRKGVLTALWLSIVTAPLIALKVNVSDQSINILWVRMALVFIAEIIVCSLWIFLLDLKQNKQSSEKPTSQSQNGLSINTKWQALKSSPRFKRGALIVLAAIAILYPILLSPYQVNIMTTALTYAVLALGLNIIIGFAGMLHLGYIAFFAIGAYSYALLNTYFGVGFWVALPIGGIAALLLSILLSIPVLRLRGDYLAIVTLASGEILRIVLENWTALTNGPRGISNISRPSIFNIDLTLNSSTILVYFLVIVILVLVVIMMRRLEYSRIGRRWEAMKEDEIAARSMGVNITKAKLSALCVGSVWAGVAGVTFAGRITFINPPSFSIWESIVVLCAVVLGGMGSIIGVVIGALVLLLIPEYFRAFSDFRLLFFGLVLIIMMLFRPGGLFPKKRRLFLIKQDNSN